MLLCPVSVGRFVTTVDEQLVSLNMSSLELSMSEWLPGEKRNKLRYTLGFGFACIIQNIIVLIENQRNVRIFLLLKSCLLCLLLLVLLLLLFYMWCSVTLISVRLSLQGWGQDGWLLTNFFSCLFMHREGVKVHKLAKKERGQYPAFLTEKAWSIKVLLFGFRENFSRAGHGR